VFVHDISPDNKLLPTPWQAQFEIALKGAFPALDRMDHQGLGYRCEHARTYPQGDAGGGSRCMSARIPILAD
jgi:hypothetical protein